MTITVKHWRRILDGELFVSTITEPDVVRKILAHLGMPTEPLPRARARDPTRQLDFGDFVA